MNTKTKSFFHFEKFSFTSIAYTRKSFLLVHDLIPHKHRDIEYIKNIHNHSLALVPYQQQNKRPQFEYKIKFESLTLMLLLHVLIHEKPYKQVKQEKNELIVLMGHSHQESK